MLTAWPIATKASNALAAIGKRRIAQLFEIKPLHLRTAITRLGALPPEQVERLREVDELLSRAFEVLDPESVLDWLEGAEPVLDDRFTSS